MRVDKNGEELSLLRRNAGVSTVVFASTAVILIVIAAVGYGLYYMSTTSTPTASSSTSQVVTGLAYSHWEAIGDANLAGTVSQYSSSAALWWYVKGSALNTTSGAYTGTAISSTWQKFFKSGPTYWTVYNYSLTFSSSTAAKVTADVWYVIGNGNSTHTLHLPYELDYNLQSGSWVLTTDWWGLPNFPGLVFTGVVTPPSAAPTTTSSSGGVGGY